MVRVHMAAPDSKLFFSQHYDAAAFRRFIGQGSKLGGFRQLQVIHPGCRQEFVRHSIAEGDGSGFIQHQHINVPGYFHGAPGHSQHIPAHKPVNAADTNGT